MKKILTLLILILFLFNTIGIYGIFLGFQFKYAQEVNRQLDNDLYAFSESITFRVPISIPYSSDDQEYQRVIGEFEHDGEVYRLVKQKLYRDTLYIVCIKDNESKKINQALTDYVKTFTDRPFSTKHQGSKLTNSIGKDYLNTGIVIEHHSSGWREFMNYDERSPLYLSFYSSRIKYPPKSTHFIF